VEPLVMMNGFHILTLLLLGGLSLPLACFA
jgi:hypothetical protein